MEQLDKILQELVGSKVYVSYVTPAGNADDVTGSLCMHASLLNHTTLTRLEALIPIGVC